VIFPQAVTRAVAEHPYPLVFATVSGAHLYGFPSPDSDWDLRGVHVLPSGEVMGLEDTRETIEHSSVQTGVELDLVTHDARKFFGLLLKRNGYVLEQLYSPIVVHGTAEHEELKLIAKGCLTRHHSHHYLGFAATQWALFEKEYPPRVKPLLYAYRVLLTGIHLMRTGEIEANLARLNDEFHLSYLPELIAIKTQGREKETLSATDVEFHRGEYLRLCAELEGASDGSRLPDAPTAKAQLSDLLLRLRTKYS
jgi:predicted nucleotidyltransferase